MQKNVALMDILAESNALKIHDFIFLWQKLDIVIDSVEVLSHLIQHGFNINQYGQLLLKSAEQKEVGKELVRLGWQMNIKDLDKLHNSNYLNLLDIFDLSPIYYKIVQHATYNDDEELAKKVVEKASVDMGADKGTPLYLAVCEQSPKCIDLFLKLGANINFPQPKLNGGTLLHYAVQIGSESLVYVCALTFVVLLKIIKQLC